MIFKILRFAILAFFCTTLARAEKNVDQSSINSLLKEVHYQSSVLEHS